MIILYALTAIFLLLVACTTAHNFSSRIVLMLPALMLGFIYVNLVYEGMNKI